MQTLFDQQGVQRSVLSLIVREALRAGISEICIVVWPGDEEPYSKLVADDGVRLTFVRQVEPGGYGHAVWCARDLIGDEPFALLLPDMLCYGMRGCMAGLMDLYNEVGGNIVAVEECAPEETSKYGIIGRGSAVRHGFAVTKMVEKPHPSEAPSNFYLNGRYILQPEIFDILARQERGAGNEVQLTDGMARMIGNSPFHGLRYEGRRFDCGDKVGFLEAQIAFALKRDDMAPAVRDFLKTYIKDCI